jgi:hypothetical protein
MTSEKRVEQQNQNGNEHAGGTENDELAFLVPLRRDELREKGGAIQECLGIGAADDEAVIAFLKAPSACGLSSLVRRGSGAEKVLTPM